MLLPIINAMTTRLRYSVKGCDHARPVVTTDYRSKVSN